MNAQRVSSLFIMRSGWLMAGPYANGGGSFDKLLSTNGGYGCPKWVKLYLPFVGIEKREQT